MWPVIWQFSLFGLPVTIYSFGTFIVLAFLLSGYLVRRRAARTLGLDKERVLNVCFVLLFLGLAGARLLYAFIHHDEFREKPLSFLYIWEGGLVFYGGLIVCLFWLLWYLPRHRDMKGWDFADIIALGAGIAIFVGRFASFFAGENYGKPTDVPWAVKFPVGAERSAVPPEMRGIALHPTQIYHALHGLILFAILWLFLRKRPWGGRATGLFLALYALGTAIIEIWRGDDAARGMVIPGYVSVSQLLSIPIFFAGITIYMLRRRPDDAPRR